MPAPQPAIDRALEADGHGLLGYYRLSIDAAAETLDVAQVRQVDMHMNVKPFVAPPACADCLKVTPTGPYAGNIFPLDITLKNPQQLTGYDVRGILISDDPGASLANPDNYTNLFDNGGAVAINPFKAYAKAVADRSFGPGSSFTEHYDLYLTSKGKVSVVDFAIDASWPSRAKEPYYINGPIISGEIDDQGNNTVPISVDVLASGNNVNGVWFNASSMGIAGELALQPVSGNTWKIDFKNTAKATVGTYLVSIRATSASSTNSLWSYFNLPIVPGTAAISLANDVQPIFNTYCTSCHGPGDEFPDLSAGHTWGSLVNKASYQSSVKLVTPGDPSMSYNQAKIRGTHLSAPFNGGGKRMPWFTPFVSDSEVALIDQWIKEGAKNN